MPEHYIKNTLDTGPKREFNNSTKAPFFHPGFESKLQSVIKESYEAGAGGQPSAAIINEVSDIVAKSLAAYVMDQSSYNIIDIEARLSLSREQARSLTDVLAEKLPIEEAIARLLKDYAEHLAREAKHNEFSNFLAAQREEEARRVFASLLQVTTEDKIKEFGDSFAESSHQARNNAIVHLNKLRDNGIFDEKLVMDFRKVLKSDKETYLFADYFGKIDLATVASTGSGPNLQTILETIGDASVVRDILFRALRSDLR
ncbi:hypothetical protein BDV37DRAFT_280830 [Aspergillus pseudonomiae]|uniref:Uncharacterized protein n=1 Tax=Aspergillus pseudonomiae TaxID=1506151 RepID=A0A5N7DJM8_9EURO|nr:uncharacterized protein BDV37DRAFT_280830 [Aspergillus pseudonomiae]KAE8406554.1 hypothetical protein BDV37DRAFT_280830 [Aspergillus pseudonomiae]